MRPQPCVCATLRKATRCVTQFYDNSLRSSGLRSTQFNILAEIRAAGEATVSQLTKSLATDQTTLTRSLALLERNKLLKTVPNPDGRVKSLQLTGKGERAFLKALPLWLKAQEIMISTIGQPAWQSLRSELDKLGQDPRTS